MTNELAETITKYTVHVIKITSLKSIVKLIIYFDNILNSKQLTN